MTPMPRHLEDEDFLDHENEEEPSEIEEDEEEEGLLDDEDTLEELDVDERGHVRPRRPRQDEDIDPEEY